ncbi:hypothetical protein JST97_35400 [bacterium]|nr:hypothetical protein [bacterium]
MSYSLMSFYCLFLLLLQLVTGLALMHGDEGARVGFDTMYLFIGLNLPTVILGSQLDRNDTTQSLKSPAGCLVMALIMANFMRAGTLAGDWSKWNSILHLLSAQSLWIAVPTWQALARR